MTTAVEAYDAIRDRIDASDSGIALPLRWQGEDGGLLPDTPAAFGYGVFENFGSKPGPTAFGGGLNNNLYRNGGYLNVYVFVPNGQGIRKAMQEAETVAARLRSYRATHILVRAADVIPLGDGASIAPPGLQSEVNNYQCALVEAEFGFDQIG